MLTTLCMFRQCFCFLCDKEASNCVHWGIGESRTAQMGCAHTPAAFELSGKLESVSIPVIVVRILMVPSDPKHRLTAGRPL